MWPKVAHKVWGDALAVPLKAECDISGPIHKLAYSYLLTYASIHVSMTLHQVKDHNAFFRSTFIQLEPTVAYRKRAHLAIRRHWVRFPTKPSFFFSSIMFVWLQEPPWEIWRQSKRSLTCSWILLFLCFHWQFALMSDLFQHRQSQIFCILGPLKYCFRNRIAAKFCSQKKKKNLH